MTNEMLVAYLFVYTALHQGRLHKGGMVRDAPWRKLGGTLWW